MIESKCPHCSEQSSWKNSRWGENARCPSCRKVITIVPEEMYRTLENERERLRNSKRQTIPVQLLLENVRSAYNVGSILRTADGCGISRIYLCGITPEGNNVKVSKTALGAEQSVPSEKHPAAPPLAERFKEEGCTVYALENCAGAADLFSLTLCFPAVFMLGNELSGLSPETIAAADQAVSIPMLGIKQSLNVASAAAVCGYLALFQYRRKEAGNP